MKKGVIFVGGLIGAGKTSLAKELAKNLDVPYFSVDEIKREVYPTDPNYEYYFKNNIPVPDETRIKTFNRTVEEMAKLSKSNPIIVVDETLHKKNSRQVLFDGAKKYFGSYLLIWVKSDESIIKQRLTSKIREGHILNDPFGMYLSLKKEFEEFESPDVVIDNNTDFETVSKNLVDLIKSKIY